MVFLSATLFGLVSLLLASALARSRRGWFSFWFAWPAAGIIRFCAFAARVVFVLVCLACRWHSLWRLRGAHVAPVRGGTYFSLPRQRKVGKRKPLHPASRVASARGQEGRVARQALASRTTLVCGPAVIHPVPHCVRPGQA